MTQAPEVAVRRVERCRLCGNPSLIPVLDLGEQYLSSVFPTSLDYRASARRYPMDLVLCGRGGATPACGLVQLGHHLDLSAMYDAYPYTSSTNSSMRRILEDVVESARALGPLRSGDVVLDIGGNDGTLLSLFGEEPLRLISIDPARNITPVFASERYTRVCGFFDAALFAEVSPEPARRIFSIAMFYHLDDPTQFARDVAACLADDGVWIIQMAYLPAMLRTNMYDNIVHEHAGYYAASHMKWLLAQVGLELFDVTENDVYGGSFRVFAQKRGAARPVTERATRLLAREQLEGLFDPETYVAFARRVAQSRDALRTLMEGVAREGKTTWVYGASTKGNTILQYCGLGSRELVAAADSNPFKHGKFLIGSDVPIVDEAAMRAAQPDYLLALPYSFIDGFLRREATLVAAGTRFIVPLPSVALRP